MVATKLRSIWQRIGCGLLLEQIVVMIVFMLIHRLKKSIIEVIVPTQDIEVFPFVLWESVKSTTFSEVAFTLVLLSHLKRQAFFWGRKADGLIKCASFFEAGNFLCCKISLKHVRCKDL
jgi:hypothetical protein